MKEKTTDEKVYEILCEIFDEFYDEYTAQIPMGGLTRILGGIKYVEDYDKNRGNRNVWLETINEWRFEISEEFKNKYMKDVLFKPWYIVFKHSDGKEERFCTSVSESEYTEACIVVNVDNYECAFRLQDLPKYMNLFRKLSKHKGKHPFPQDKPLNERGRYFAERSKREAAKDVENLIATLSA